MKLFNVALLIACLTLLCPTGYAKDELPNTNAVILLYHHVSEDTPPSTSISPDKFAEHMQYLADSHTVIPLKELVENLKNKRSLPKNSVAITFDDGYLNIAQNAHPILRKHGFEYTIFINPPQIGVIPQQLDWPLIKRLMAEGVSFANHTSYHNHLLTGSDKADWLQNTLEDIALAEAELLQQTGNSFKYLAYPYGEFNQRLQRAIGERDYIGFGQQSGAVASYSDFTALPRVPAAGIYANIKTLKVKLNSFAMPIVDKRIKDPHLTYEARRPEQTLTVDLTDIHPNQLACFRSGKPIELIRNGNQFTMPITEDLPIGRSRINCTAPSKTLPERFYWYSQPWFVPDHEGNWPE